MKNNKKIIIWALYDDADCSYNKTIQKYFNQPNQEQNIEVHSFGINNPPKNNINFLSNNHFYHQMDLSLNNINLISQLSNIAQEFQHPNIILASPPCESWSGADCAGTMVKSISHDGTWIIQNRKYYDNYNQTCHLVKKRYFLQKEQSRIIGEATIGATIQIIEHFQPQIWVIENPQTSKTWNFQKHHWNFHGIENLTYYSSYDPNFSPKPTIFKSNIRLNLKNKKVLGNNNHMSKGNYTQRSAIPLLLVKDLLTQIISNKVI